MTHWIDCGPLNERRRRGQLHKILLLCCCMANGLLCVQHVCTSSNVPIDHKCGYTDDPSVLLSFCVCLFYLSQCLSVCLCPSLSQQCQSVCFPLSLVSVSVCKLTVTTACFHSGSIWWNWKRHHVYLLELTGRSGDVPVFIRVTT